MAVDRGEEGERMEVGEKKQPSYLDYIQLWLHIMDPTKLKVLLLTRLLKAQLIV